MGMAILLIFLFAKLIFVAKKTTASMLFFTHKKFKNEK